MDPSAVDRLTRVLPPMALAVAWWPWWGSCHSRQRPFLKLSLRRWGVDDNGARSVMTLGLTSATAKGKRKASESARMSKRLRQPARAFRSVSPSVQRLAGCAAS